MVLAFDVVVYALDLAFYTGKITEAEYVKACAVVDVEPSRLPRLSIAKFERQRRT